MSSSAIRIPIEDEQGNGDVFVNLAELFELFVQLRFTLPQGTFGQLAPRYVDDRKSAFPQRFARYGFYLCIERLLRPLRNLNLKRIFTLSREYVVEECNEGDLGGAGFWRYVRLFDALLPKSPVISVLSVTAHEYIVAGMPEYSRLKWLVMPIGVGCLIPWSSIAIY